MPSIVPGFEYDIFISYRQKDNKGERWVTEFIQALKVELEATFKDDITIYFDENPHDGLLETHDVDGSLKDKLNCLVFIPIISQTYCDPKSFAWNNEFLAFIKTAIHFWVLVNGFTLQGSDGARKKNSKTIRMFIWLPSPASLTSCSSRLNVLVTSVIHTPLKAMVAV